MVVVHFPQRFMVSAAKLDATWCIYLHQNDLHCFKHVFSSCQSLVMKGVRVSRDIVSYKTKVINWQQKAISSWALIETLVVKQSLGTGLKFNVHFQLINYLKKCDVFQLIFFWHSKHVIHCFITQNVQNTWHHIL